MSPPIGHDFVEFAVGLVFGFDFQRKVCHAFTYEACIYENSLAPFAEKPFGRFGTPCEKMSRAQAEFDEAAFEGARAA